jgi:hypothetical protein
VQLLYHWEVPCYREVWGGWEGSCGGVSESSFGGIESGSGESSGGGSGHGVGRVDNWGGDLVGWESNGRRVFRSQEARVGV